MYLYQSEGLRTDYFLRVHVCMVLDQDREFVLFLFQHFGLDPGQASRSVQQTMASACSSVGSPLSSVGQQDM